MRFNLKHSTALLLIGLATPVLAAYRPLADVDKLDAELHATPDGAMLTVEYRIDFDLKRGPYPNQPAVIFTVRERGNTVVDSEGVPLEFIVELEGPYKADHKDLEFRGEVDLEVPVDVLYDPRRLELLAEVVSDGQRAPLAAREKRISVDRYAGRYVETGVMEPVHEPIVTPAYPPSGIHEYPVIESAPVIVTPQPVYVAPPPVYVPSPVFVERAPRFSVAIGIHRTTVARTYGVHRTVVRSVRSAPSIRPPIHHPAPRPPIIRHHGHRPPPSLAPRSGYRSPSAAPRGTTVRPPSSSGRSGFRPPASSGRSEFRPPSGGSRPSYTAPRSGSRTTQWPPGSRTGSSFLPNRSDSMPRFTPPTGGSRPSFTPTRSDRRSSFAPSGNRPSTTMTNTGPRPSFRAPSGTPQKTLITPSRGSRTEASRGSSRSGPRDSSSGRRGPR